MNQIGNLLISYYIIGSMTIKEAMRKKILIIILFVSVFFLLLNLTCSSSGCQINGEQKQVDVVGQYFFFFLVAFWNFGIAEQITSSLVTEELENKNYLIFFSKPISKFNYYMGKALGIMTIILANSVFVYTIYSISSLVQFGKINTELWMALLPMLLGFFALVSIVLFFALAINKTGAVLLSSVLVIVSMIINGIFYEPNAEKAVLENSIKNQIFQVIYWILPQFGSLFYYASSLFQKNFSQVHSLGEYSIAQMSAWTILIWVGIKKYLDKKEFEG